MYKAVIFDFFDVIRTDAYKSWLSLHGYKNEGPFLEANKAMDRGDITTGQFLQRLSDITGQPPDQMLAEMEDGAQLDYDVVGQIEQLSKTYKIGLLTNAPSAFIRQLLHSHNLEKHFDAIIVSSEVGIIKPDPEIFKYILKQLGVQPNEALFIDDNPANIHGAEEVGIKGIVFVNAVQLRGDLQKLL